MDMDNSNTEGFLFLTHLQTDMWFDFWGQGVLVGQPLSKQKMLCNIPHPPVTKKVETFQYHLTKDLGFPTLSLPKNSLKGLSAIENF